MTPEDELRIAQVKEALGPKYRQQVPPPRQPYRPQKSTEPLYPPTQAPKIVAPSGESIGKAWTVAQQALPDEWHVTRLALDKGHIWHASAAPATSWAFVMAHKEGLNPKQRYLSGEGISAIAALLDLAVIVESWPEPSVPPAERLDSVDALFDSLFDPDLQD